MKKSTPEHPAGNRAAMVAAGAWLTLGILLAACTAKTTDRDAPAQPPSTTPAIAADNTLDDARKALGVTDLPSQQCGACHGGQLSSWENSLHAHSVLDAQAHPPQGDFSHTYFCSNEGIVKVLRGHYKERYVLDHPEGELALSLSPCEWDFKNSCMKTGDVSGEPPNWIGDCAGCHTSRLNPETGARLEDTVGCVMCHGPYSWHDGKKMMTFTGTREEETPRQKVEACGQCHVQGGYSPDGNRRYANGYLPFQASLSGSYRMPAEHLDEKATGDPKAKSLLSYDHILYAFQGVIDGRSSTTCVDCHTLHPQGGGSPTWQKHATLPEETVCKTCHVVETNDEGRRPAIPYNPDCPVCSAKGACL